MPPEQPPYLVILDTSFEEDGLKGKVEYVKPAEKRLRVRWGVGSPPRGYRKKGGGVVFVADYSDSPPPPNETPAITPHKKRYSYSEGLAGAPWLMLVMILPAEHILTKPSPVPDGSHLFGNRLAVYWRLSKSAGVTDVCRILILHNNNFVGLMSTQTIKRQLPGIHTELAKFERQLAKRKISGIDLRQEIEEILDAWNKVLPIDEERCIQKQVTRANLKRWFGDTMLSEALSITDLGSATAFDLARLLDFPSGYVPVITSHRPESGTRKVETTVKVVDKIVLNSQLARTYLNDLLNRSGIQT